MARPTSAGGTNSFDETFLVQVQHTRDYYYKVYVPLQLCRLESPSLEGVFDLVRQAHREPASLNSGTKMFSFESSEWTSLNLHLLLTYSYILLGESVELLPADRRFKVRALPASRTLTDPTPVSGIEGHEDAIFASPSEFIDNSLRALRGSAGNKKIAATFNLESQASSGSEGEPGPFKDFIAFYDTGCGMTFQTLQDWAKWRSLPVEDAGSAGVTGVSPYFADGNLSCFGMGSKAAGWTFGQDILIITKPNVGPQDWKKRPVYEMRCNKPRMMTKALSSIFDHLQELDDQEHEVGGSFHFEPQRRLAGTDGSCRTAEEKANARLMELIRQADQEEHFTLIIISRLHLVSMQKLLSKPFQTLCKMLKGMYFYYAVPGTREETEQQAGTTARAKFLYGEGYRHGPVEIEINGIGFDIEGPKEPTEEAAAVARSEMQRHRLDSLPWKGWPEQPPSDEEDDSYEDIMHKLARLTEKSTFTTNLKGNLFREQVVGNKFVFGMIIKAGSMVTHDVFVKGYLHYMPYVNGAYTKAALGLKKNVRWVAFWKGRQIPFADITALLPFMEKSKSNKPAAYRYHLEQQVVGQLFFQSVTEVNQYKTRFLGAVNDELSNTDQQEERFTWFHVVESELYNNAAYDSEVPATGLTRRSPGLNPTTITRLTDECATWVEECHNRFDEQFKVGIEFEEKSQAGTFTAYKSLTAKHLNHHVFSVQDRALVKHITGGTLSHYTHVQGDKLVPANMSTVLCRIQYFKVLSGHSDNQAKAVVTREPKEHFGPGEFEFDVHKLSAPEEEMSSKREDLEAAMNFVVSAKFESKEREASGLHKRVVAGKALPHAVVTVHNEGLGPRRSTNQVVQWTNANPDNPKKVVKLIVEQHICKEEDPNHEVVHTADFVRVGQVYSFEFSTQSKPITLSQPGKYRTWFTAHTGHHDGMQTPAKSKEHQYIVVCGDVVSCQLHPEHQAPKQPIRLHSKLDAIAVQLLDDQGNTYGDRGTRLPDITYECSVLDVDPVAGQSACLESNAHAEHQLKLPQLVMKPKTRAEDSAGLIFPQPDKPVRCMITVHISKLPTSQGSAGNVSVTFPVRILPGIPTSLRFKELHAYFSLSDEQPEQHLENRCAPTPNHFAIELIDDDGYRSSLDSSIQASLQISASLISHEGVIGHDVTLRHAKPKLSTGVTRIKNLAVDIPSIEFQSANATQGLRVKLTATWSDDVEPLEFLAVVKPSSTPSVMQVYMTSAMDQPLPVEDVSDDLVFVLHQEAGTEVEQLFMTLNNEAGNLREMPQINMVKINKRPAEVEPAGSCIRIVPGPDCKLKLPSSLEPQDRALEVHGVGWTKSATIRLHPSPGLGCRWVLKLLESPHEDNVKNSESLEPRIVAHMVDKFYNQCDVLPTDVDLVSKPPQLTVQPAQLGADTAGTRFSVADTLGRYSGRWGFENGVLSMPDLALLGPQGTVQLMMNGGRSNDGQPIKGDMLSLQLQVGSIAQCCYTGWPKTGDQPSHVTVRMSLTFQDEAGNHLDVPAGKLYAKIFSANTSARACCFGSQSVKLLVTWSQHEQRLSIDPFRLMSTHSGLHTWKLEVRKEPKGAVVATAALDAFSMMPSSRIVRDIVPLDCDGITEFVAGRMPPLRFRLKTENGQVYPQASELASNITAVCTSIGPAADTTIVLNICESGDDALECMLPPDVACKAAGHYKVLISYKELDPHSLGLEPSEASASLELRLVAKPGVAQQLSVPSAAIASRTVLNAGTDQQRTILPRIRLRLVDEYHNTVAHSGVSGCLLVKVEVQNDQDVTVAGFAVDPCSIQLPVADGAVSMGPVLLQPATTPAAGTYFLRISVPDLPCLRIAFDLEDASGINAAVERALAACNEAACKAESASAKLARKKAILQQQQRALQGIEQAVREHVPSDVVNSTPEQKLQRCQADLAEMVSRSEHQHAMIPHPLHQQLKAIKGVLGFLHEFIFVSNGSDARLLSWMAKDKMQSLVVVEYEVTKAVTQACPDFKGRMLSLDIADMAQLFQMPHIGLQNVPLDGNPVYFSDLVTAVIKPHRMQGISAAQLTQAEGQLICYACGNLLRLGSADAAIQYIKAVKAQGIGCPSIVCQTGELITSSGEVGNGAAFRAPKSFKELPLYFDSLPKLQRPEGQKLQQAIEELSAMPSLRSAVQDAQSAYDTADTAVRNAEEAVIACEKAYQEARKAAELLKTREAGPSNALRADAEAASSLAGASSDSDRGRKRQRGDGGLAAYSSPAVQTPARKNPRRTSAQRTT